MPTYINPDNLPERVIRQLALPYQPKIGRMAVSHLIDSPLIRTLLIKEWDNLTLNYSDYLVPIFGVSVHKRQELLVEDDEQAEKKLEDVVDNITIAGKSDVYVKSEKVIRDTKVCKVGWAKFNLTKLEGQLNTYCWQRRKRGQEITGLEGDLYYRDHDWKEVAFPRGQDYPKILYENIKVSLWSFEQQEQFIKDRLEYHRKRADTECTLSEKFQRPSQYAVMKQGRKSALRLLNTLGEAHNWCFANKCGYPTGETIVLYEGITIVERPAMPLRCKFFCSASSKCPFRGE